MRRGSAGWSARTGAAGGRPASWLDPVLVPIIALARVPARVPALARGLAGWVVPTRDQVPCCLVRYLALESPVLRVLPPAVLRGLARRGHRDVLDTDPLAEHPVRPPL